MADHYIPSHHVYEKSVFSAQDPVYMEPLPSTADAQSQTTSVFSVQDPSSPRTTGGHSIRSQTCEVYALDKWRVILIGNLLAVIAALTLVLIITFTSSSETSPPGVDVHATVKSTSSSETSPPGVDVHATVESNGTPCPRNMIYGNCTCGGTCVEPIGSSGCPRDCELDNEGCYCPAGFLMDGDECVPWSECPCFWSEINIVIPDGQSQVNNNCTKRRSCTENQLADEEEYQCDSDTRCTLQDDIRQCYCNDGFRGDGQNCEPQYADCYDAYINNHTEDGVYLIKPTNWPGSAFNVSCVMSTNDGGWTVFQRRTDGYTNFYRNWTSYREGFGSFDGDFWLGNEKIYYLTNQKGYRLRVDYLTSSNTARYEEYSSFSIGTEDNEYRLTATGASGSAGPGMNDNNGKAFSTYDEDNDACGTHNFAERSRGAWWYTNNSCVDSWSTGSSDCCVFLFGSMFGFTTHSNLNGDYNGATGRNIFWCYNIKYCNLNFAEMKIRPSG